MENKKTTGNIGEWSELYTLAFILAHNGLYGADKNQGRINTLFYKTLSVVLDDENYYKINEDSIELVNNFKSIKNIEKNEVVKLANKILEELLFDNEGRAFSIKSGLDFMDLIEKKSIGAPNTRKKRYRPNTRRH